MLRKIDNLKNWKLLLITGVAGILLIILVIVILFAFNSEEKTFKNEYEKLNGKVSSDGKQYPEVNIDLNNNIKYSSSEEIIQIFEERENAVIYFGYPTCIYCRTAIQVLYDTSKDMELDIIYYLDVEEKDNKYDELMEMLDEKFIETKNKKKNVYAPLVLFVSHGNVVSYNKGTLSTHKDPYTKLADSQTMGLSEIFRYGISDVLNS